MHTKLVTATAFSILLAVGGAMAQSSTGSGGSGGTGAGENGMIGGSGTMAPGAGTTNNGAQPIDPGVTNSTTNGVNDPNSKSRDCSDTANTQANSAPNADPNSAIDNKCK